MSAKPVGGKIENNHVGQGKSEYLNTFSTLDMIIFRILMLFFAEPDNDEPQPMGEDSGEVDMSEEAMDKFNDKRSEAMSAFSDGDFQVWPLLHTQFFGCLLVFS